MLEILMVCLCIVQGVLPVKKFFEKFQSVDRCKGQYI